MRKKPGSLAHTPLVGLRRSSAARESSVGDLGRCSVLNRALRRGFQNLKSGFFNRGFVGASMITGSSDGPRRRHGVRRLWKRIRSPAATPYGLEQVDERRVIERRVSGASPDGSKAVTVLLFTEGGQLCNWNSPAPPVIPCHRSSSPTSARSKRSPSGPGCRADLRCSAQRRCIAANPARKWISRSPPKVVSQTHGDAQNNPLMQAARREMPDLPTRWRSGRLRTTSVGEIASWTWAGPRLSHEYFDERSDHRPGRYPAQPVGRP